MAANILPNEGAIPVWSTAILFFNSTNMITRKLALGIV
jgi:hypothetical protein